MSNYSITPSQNNHNPLQFIFQDQPIRIIQGDDNQPLFVASDVCKAVEITNVSQALSRLDDDEKGDIILNDTIGRPQKMSVVTESGLYTLILSSRKPEVKEFKRWITHDVLPSIRKTGGYEIPKDLTPIEKSRQLLNVLVSIQDTVEAQQHRLDEHTERIASLEAHVQPEIEYFTALAYFRKRNLPTPDMSEVQSLGQKAARISRERGVKIGKTSDPRFGEVNTYSIHILDQIMLGAK